MPYPLRTIAAAVTLTAAALAGCHPAETPTTAPTDAGHDEKPAAATVTLTAVAVSRYGIRLGKATPHVLVPTAVAPARVAYDAERTAHVGVPVGGRVAEVPVHLGDTVARGDLLAVIDSPELGEAQSEYLQRRTAVDVARPAVDLAQAAVDRAEKLMRQDQGLSMTEVQRRQGDLQVARGTLRTAEGGLVAAGNKLGLLGMSADAIAAVAKDGRVGSRYEVRSPIAGQVVRRDVTPGEFVRPDRESLVVVVDLSTLWVIADVGQGKLADVSVGDAAHLSLPTGVVDGRVSYIAPDVDPETRTGQVRIEVAPAAGHPPLRAGMFVPVGIELSHAPHAAEPVLAVPDAAVQTIDGTPVVFVPVDGKANTFAKRAISTAEPVGSWVPVLSGLTDGQDVVVGGSFVLKADLGKAGVGDD